MESLLASMFPDDTAIIYKRSADIEMMLLFEIKLFSTKS